jgi:hypothetical protein
MQEQRRSTAERQEPKGKAETAMERDEREMAGDKDRSASRKAAEGSRGKRRRGGGSGSGPEEPA